MVNVHLPWLLFSYHSCHKLPWLLIPWFLLCYHSNCLDSHSVPESGVQFMQLRFCYHGYSSVVLSHGCSVQIVSILVPFKDESTHIIITVCVQQLLWQLFSYHTGSCFPVTMAAHLWLQHNSAHSEMTRASLIHYLWPQYDVIWTPKGLQPTILNSGSQAGEHEVMWVPTPPWLGVHTFGV